MRYTAKREESNDWGVFDGKRQMFVATGLSMEEASEGAKLRNKEAADEAQKFLSKSS